MSWSKLLIHWLWKEIVQSINVDVLISYTLSDGHKRVEKGFFKNVTANADPNDPKAAKAGVVMGVTGSYEWLGPDGNTYHTDFTADEVW